jgi:hypothetical protein
MTPISIKAVRDKYLRTKNRFYQCGWLDAERGEPQQVKAKTDLDEGHVHYENDYVIGYNDSMKNQEEDYLQQQVNSNG